MIEYPSILPSSKAPREHCMAFEKIDGSNIRVKYTNKKGFHLFGSRNQLLDKNHPFLGEVVDIFYKEYENPLVDAIEENWPNEREIIVYGEFFGLKSFAGFHQKDDPKKFVLFDIMVGHKNRKFVLPQDFIDICDKHNIKRPRVVYVGNLTDEFIKDVRDNKFDLAEGVVCKGTKPTGAHRGHVWMAKIKTQKYIDSLRKNFGDEGVNKYGE